MQWRSRARYAGLATCECQLLQLELEVMREWWWLLLFVLAVGLNDRSWWFR